MILEQVPPEIAKIFDKEFVQDWWTSTKVVMRRQVTLVLRSRSFLYARMIQVRRPYVFQSVINFRVFMISKLDLEVHDQASHSKNPFSFSSLINW